jgi:hypothetical protein
LFTITPKSDLSTGTDIQNRATIVFDENPPISTPGWLNILDNTKPTSQVLSLAAVQTSPSFQVQWSGSDEGAGILDHTIFVSENGGPFTVFLRNTASPSATFTGQTGKTYAFYSMARDQTGNVEDTPAGPDTTTRVAAAKQLTALSPARVWVGLKNSDAVGLQLDLRAEVLLNGTTIGVGELNNVSSGSSGFNNAKLNTIPLSLFAPIEVPANAALKITLSVRRSCSGGGHPTGTARLWVHDSQANSRFGAMIGETASDLFLRSGFVLATTPGAGPKQTIDVGVDNKASCPNRPFKPFGTWNMTLP